MAVRYAYLKPSAGDSPFYAHVTLDGKARTLRVYWHMSWWKSEAVDPALFARWRATFEELATVLERAKPAVKKNSYRVQGRCRVSSALLKDLMGFVESDTQPEVPVKLACYVNAENKIVEVELTAHYRPLGSWPQGLLKLPQVFTTNPDYETVRAKLVFFDPSRVVRGPVGGRAVSDEALPRHHGSPEVARRAAAAAASGVPDMRLDEAVADEFAVDTVLDTRDGHPYGRAFAEEPQAAAGAAAAAAAAEAAERE